MSNGEKKETVRGNKEFFFEEQNKIICDCVAPVTYGKSVSFVGVCVGGWGVVSRD